MTPPVLQLRDLSAGYGSIRVLHGVDLHVERGEVVVLLGANGAGKTTLMRAISGLVSCSDGVFVDGQSTKRWSSSSMIRKGVTHVPQGRGTFADLSVEDNLTIGAFTRRDRAEVRADMERWMDVFPVLRTRRKQQAGLLSGGEQQMLAVARGLMARPQLLMLDEPSLGLAPMMSAELFRQLKTIRNELEMAMLVVEQNARLALSLADRGYVLVSGHMVSSGSAAELADNDDVRLAYLGK